MDLTVDDLDTALSHLDDGLLLVQDRNTARWQHPERSHLYFEVEPTRAAALFEALDERFEVRRENGRRILTSTPVADGTLPAGNVGYMADRYAPLKDLAERVSLTYAGLTDAAKRDLFDTEQRRLVREGQNRMVRCAVANETLARYLAERGETGVLRTPAGEELTIEHYRETVTLDRHTYSVKELAEALGSSRTMVDRLPADEIPTTTGRYDRMEFVTGPALAYWIEEVWPLNVRIAAGASLPPEAAEVAA